MKNEIFNHRWLAHLAATIRERFDLAEDSAPQQEVVECISRGVIFRGTNLWILIFATLVASLGLNVNSTAVIIGAMLISPLMGPIMGMGLSLGINDFDLLKKSLRNFGFMACTSIITATAYFIISPLTANQSELLARTTPTTYDVLIAFFGGAAGMVAQTRKDKTSTVIAGVAIATALMPPLCTAGFGLATLQLTYFLGAAYLFFINVIFIALATYLVVRILKYEHKVFVEEKTARKVHRIMTLITIITLIPSTILAYRIIRETIFEQNADRYVSTVFQFQDTRVLEYSKRYHMRPNRNSVIEIVLFGQTLSDDVIDNARAQLPEYDLKKTDLIVRQSSGNNAIDISDMQKGYAQIIDEKNRLIRQLQSQIREQKRDDTVSAAQITRECGAIAEGISSVSLSRQNVYTPTGECVDTVLVCVISAGRPVSSSEKAQLERWLQIRGGIKNVKLYVE